MIFITNLMTTATFAAPPPATFRFARGVLSNDMVLQSAPQQAMIWGFVPLNATVTVTLGANTLQATIGQDQASDLDPTVPAMNTFRVLLPATPASFDKYNISATYSETTIYLRDIMFGDVWGTSVVCLFAVRARDVSHTRLPPSTTLTRSLLWPVKHAVPDCLFSALLERVERELYGSEQIAQHCSMRLRVCEQQRR